MTFGHHEISCLADENCCKYAVQEIWMLEYLSKRTTIIKKEVFMKARLHSLPPRPCFCCKKNMFQSAMDIASHDTPPEDRAFFEDTTRKCCIKGEEMGLHKYDQFLQIGIYKPPRCFLYFCPWVALLFSQWQSRMQGGWGGGEGVCMHICSLWHGVVYDFSLLFDPMNPIYPVPWDGPSFIHSLPAQQFDESECLL